MDGKTHEDEDNQDNKYINNGVDNEDNKNHNMIRLVMSIIANPYLYHPITEWVKFSADKNIITRLNGGSSATEVSPITPQGRIYSEIATTTSHQDKLDNGPLWKLDADEHLQILNVLLDQYNGYENVIPWCLFKYVFSAALEGTFCSYWTPIHQKDFNLDEYEADNTLKSPVYTNLKKKESKSLSTHCDIYKPLPGCRTDSEKGVKNEMFLEKFAKLSRIIRLKSSPPFTIYRLFELVINAKSIHPIRVWSWSRAIEKCITGVSNMDGGQWNNLNDTIFSDIKYQISGVSLMNDTDFVTPYRVRSRNKIQEQQEPTQYDLENCAYDNITTTHVKEI